MASFRRRSADSIDPRWRAFEPEVKPGAEMALVPSAAVDFIEERQVFRHDLDLGSNSIAVALDSLQPDLQPVVPVLESFRKIVGSAGIQITP